MRDERGRWEPVGRWVILYIKVYYIKGTIPLSFAYGEIHLPLHKGGFPVLCVICGCTYEQSFCSRGGWWFAVIGEVIFCRAESKSAGHTVCMAEHFTPVRRKSDHREP